MQVQNKLSKKLEQSGKFGTFLPPALIIIISVVEMIKTIKSSNYNSYTSQKMYLDNSKTDKTKRMIERLGMRFLVFPKVYGSSQDSELMAKTVIINKRQDFLEIGTGCGVVAIYISRKCRKGIATDINPQAIRNAKYNAKRLGTNNLTFVKSDIFNKVNGKFDVVVFNPPYSDYKARDVTDRMFWDTNNEAKIKFFQGVKKHLKPSGRIYFGWANFRDLDTCLPFRLIRMAGLQIIRITKKKSDEGFNFFVFEIRDK